MKTKYMISVLYIVIGIGYSQSLPLTLYNVPDFESCTEALEQAERDFDKGKVWSLEGTLDYLEKDYSEEFVQLYKTYFYAKYNIEFFLTVEACMATTQQYCYARRIDSILMNTYGKNFFETEKLKIEKLYKESQSKEFSEIIDLDKAYFYLDSNPKFIGNDKVLNEFLKEKFKIDLAKEISNVDVITLIIDSDGIVTDYRVNNINIEHGSKKKTIQEINALGDWISGYLYGLKVKSQCEFRDFN